VVGLLQSVRREERRRQEKLLLLLLPSSSRAGGVIILLQAFLFGLLRVHIFAVLVTVIPQIK